MKLNCDRGVCVFVRWGGGGLNKKNNLHGVGGTDIFWNITQ